MLHQVAPVGIGEGGVPGDRREIQGSTGICHIFTGFMEAGYHLVSHCLTPLLLFSGQFILFICALMERGMKLYGVS